MNDHANPIADELRVCSELDSPLLNQLADLLNENVDCSDTCWLQSSLSLLCTKVDREFSLNDEEYLASVLEEFPNWDTRVETLRQQRHNLHQRLHRMRSQLAGLPDSTRLVRLWRDRFRKWILEYSEHRRAERDLLQEAVMTDIGVGD